MNKELILKKSLIGSKREYLEFVIRCPDFGDASPCSRVRLLV